MICYTSETKLLSLSLPLNATVEAVAKHPVHLAKVATTLAAAINNDGSGRIAVQNGTNVHIFNQSAPINIATINETATDQGREAFASSINAAVKNAPVGSVFTDALSAKYDLLSFLARNTSADDIVLAMKDGVASGVTLSAANETLYSSVTTTTNATLLNVPTLYASADAASALAKTAAVEDFIAGNTALNATTATNTILGNLGQNANILATALNSKGVAANVSAEANGDLISFSAPKIAEFTYDLFESIASNFATSNHTFTNGTDYITINFNYPSLNVTALNSAASEAAKNAFVNNITTAANTSVIHQVFANVTDLTLLLETKANAATIATSITNKGFTLNAYNDTLSSLHTSIVNTKLLNITETLTSAKKEASDAQYKVVLEALGNNPSLNISKTADIIVSNLQGNTSSLVEIFNNNNITATEDGSNNVIFDKSFLTTINLAKSTNITVVPELRASLNSAIATHSVQAMLEKGITTFLKYVANLQNVTLSAKALASANALDMCCPADKASYNEASCTKATEALFATKATYVELANEHTAFNHNITLSGNVTEAV